MRIGCRRVSRGKAQGEAMISKEPLSFLGGIDAKTGVVIEKGHPFEGRSIAGKVLFFPKGKGSTVGAYVIYQLKKAGAAPAAIVCEQADAMVASGAIIAGIPMVHRVKSDASKITDGTAVIVNADEEYLEASC
jgi:phosphomecalonate degydratase small subunit